MANSSCFDTDENEGEESILLFEGIKDSPLILSPYDSVCYSKATFSSFQYYC